MQLPRDSLGRRRRARRRVAAAGAAVTLLAACGGGQTGSSGLPATPATTAASPAGSPPGLPLGASVLRWGSCPAGAGLGGLQCAALTVPLDYADPAKGTIAISLDRHRATGKAIGSLLINPGGPGVSGVNFLPGLLPILGPSVTANFDVVGFDPRGVGRSAPVTCGSGPQLDAELSADPAPTTASGLAALVAADRRFAAGCEARSGRILPHVGTSDVARDLDRIRAALGDARLTYLGFSYGTLLGATYAQLFPTRVRAMVLDGAIDPGLSPVPFAQTQAAALDHELAAFFASCVAGRCGWHPSGGPAAGFAALLHQVESHPVAVPGGDQAVGAAALLFGTAAALYEQQSWPLLGRALTSLQAGKGAPMLELFDFYVGRDATGAYSNEVEAENAVNCLGAPAPSIAALHADAVATVRDAPVFGLLDLYGELACAVWPVPANARPGPITAPGSPPIVVVGTTQDPITPYAWARTLARQLAHGVLLTRTGFGHTGYPFSSCIRTDVDRYLLDGTPPAAGTTCPSG